MYGKEERDHRLVREGIAERVIAFEFEENLSPAPLPPWRLGEQREGQERVLSPSQKAEADGKAVAEGRRLWLKRNSGKEESGRSEEVERSAAEKQAGEGGQSKEGTDEVKDHVSEQLQLSFV